MTRQEKFSFYSRTIEEEKRFQSFYSSFVKKEKERKMLRKRTMYCSRLQYSEIFGAQVVDVRRVCVYQ